MSSGFGLPVLNLQGAIAKIGDAYTDSYDKAVQQNALSALGTRLQAGDYAGAAKTAFDAGDAATGLSLIKLGQSAEQAKQASAAFGALGGYYGGGGGGGAPANGLDAVGAGGATPPTPPPAPGASRSLPTFAQDPAMLRNALAIQGNESGGNYGIVGPTHPKYGRALGAYQVMESNLPSWSRETLGRVVSPDEFLRSPDIQDAIFQKKFGQSVAKYGNPQDAASVWFTGRPLAQGANAKDVLGTTGQRYVDKFTAGLSRVGGGAPQQAASLPPGASGLNPARPAQVASVDPSFAPQGSGAGSLLARPSAAPAFTAAPPSIATTMRMPGADSAPARGDGEEGDGVAVTPPTVTPPTVSAPNREQISAQAPQHLERAGFPPQAAVAVGNTAPGSQARIGVLMRIAGMPGLNGGQSGVVKALLASELEQTKLPEVQRNYLLARSQGFNGSIIDYQNELRKPLTPTTVAPGNAVIFPGERAPAYINPKDDKGFADVTDLHERKAAGVPDWYTGTVQRGPDNRIYYPGAGQQGVTPEQKIENAGAAKLSEAKVGGVVEAIEAAKPAAERLRTLATLADAWKSGEGKITTGPAGEGALKLKQFAKGTLGIDPSGLTETELVQKVGTQLAAQASKSLTSRPTQFDFQVFLQNNPGINLSPKGNLALISLMQQQAKNELGLSQLARQQKNGDNWEDVVAKYDREHPIISPLTGRPLDPTEVVFPAPPGQGGGAAGGSDSGTQLKPMSSDVLGEARAAIRSGRPAAAVMQRLREHGYDPGGL